MLNKVPEITILFWIIKIMATTVGETGAKAFFFRSSTCFPAIGWALVYILPGVFFSTSLAVAGSVSTRLAVIVFSLVACIWGFI